MSTGYRGGVRWRFLLRPGWVALTAAVICFTVAAFTVLAPWQFRRAAQRAERNTGIESSFTTPLQPLRSALAAHAAPTRATEWRHVQVTGHYLPDTELVVRLRTVQGEPAYEVLVALRMADGSTILVNRGYLRPAEGVRIPPYPPVPGGEVTVTGRLRTDEQDPQSGEVVRQDGHRQVYAVSTRTVSAATGVPLDPGYLQLVERCPRGAVRVAAAAAGPWALFRLRAAVDRLRHDGPAGAGLFRLAGSDRREPRGQPGTG